MNKGYWESSNTQLFCEHLGEFPMYMPRVGISRMRWIPKLEGRALVTFFGMLPVGVDIFDFDEAATYYITHKHCGDRRMFYKDEVIYKCTNCKVVSKYTNTIVAICSEDVDLLKAYVLVKCDVEMFPDNGAYQTLWASNDVRQKKQE